MDPDGPLIIGLYSPAPQSGKSTIAAILEQRRGFSRWSFAGALKGMVWALMRSYGMSDAEILVYSEEKKEEEIPVIGASFRHLCQTLGTDWGRTLVHPDLWTRGLRKRIAGADRVVVEDVRFPNEYDAIKEAGGLMWKVVRPGARGHNGHPSEGLLTGFGFDAVFVNSGDLQRLAASVVAEVPK